MAQLPESWQPIADTLGYVDEQQMLIDLYINQKMSISALTTRLGFCQNNVRNHLHAAGIVPRSRGGPNSLGKTKFRHYTDEALMALKPGDLIKLADGTQIRVIFNTLYKERRRRGLIKCISVPSPRQNTSTAIAVECTPNLLLLSGVLEVLPTTSGIASEESPEISSS